MTTPNVYHLHGQHISVTYSETTFDGKPTFEYHDEIRSLLFKGDEIRTVESEVGTLVSVTLQLTVDSGSTSFTLLVPHVNLPDSNASVNISTEGIITRHRFSIIPRLNVGQTDLYRFIPLTGTAQLIVF